MSYIQYYSREIFTTVRKQLWIDGDGLSGQQRKLILIHNFLIIPEGIQGDVEDQVNCVNWHSRCTIQVPSIEKAFELWNCIQKLPSNACHLTSISKGILIGRKDIKLETMPCEYKKYVRWYLSEKGSLEIGMTMSGILE